MNIYQAVEILKEKENYIVPKSEFDEAIEVSIKFIENVIDISSKKWYIIHKEEYITMENNISQKEYFRNVSFCPFTAETSCPILFLVPDTGRNGVRRRWIFKFF